MRGTERLREVRFRGVYYSVAHSGRVITAGARQVLLPKEQATVVVGTDPATAIHEYTRHLQVAMPKLDGLFQALHRRRTHGEPVIDLPGYPGHRGRKDQYIDSYYGAEWYTLERDSASSSH